MNTNISEHKTDFASLSDLHGDDADLARFEELLDERNAASLRDEEGELAHLRIGHWWNSNEVRMDVPPQYREQISQLLQSAKAEDK